MWFVALSLPLGLSFLYVIRDRLAIDSASTLQHARTVITLIADFGLTDMPSILLSTSPNSGFSGSLSANVHARYAIFARFNIFVKSPPYVKYRLTIDHVLAW